MPGFKKKQGNSKQDWLDWLSDEPPAAAAQQELRQQRVQQVNSYSYRPRRPQAPQPATPVFPAQPIATPQSQHVQHPARQQKVPPAVQPQQTHSSASKPAAPAAVSIQIQIPALDTEKIKRRKQAIIGKFKQLFAQAKTLVLANKKRSGIVAGMALLVLVGLFVPPLLHHDSQKGQTVGSAGSGSAGGSISYAKPPFTVVVPSTKPSLATPDGSHSAYDGNRNVYSYSDSIGANGFIVSQQPIPANFPDGDTAAAKIAPTLSPPAQPQQFKTLFGTAYMVTNVKSGAESLVFHVRNLLVFIQSSYAFTTQQWTDYINALQ